MAHREEQTEAFWEDPPLPEQFPDPHAEGSDETIQGEVGGTSTSVNTEESTREYPQQSSPNLLLMLRSAESWRRPLGGDGAQGRTATPDLLGEAQRVDMVSGTETL